MVRRSRAAAILALAGCAVWPVAMAQDKPRGNVSAAQDKPRVNVSAAQDKPRVNVSAAQDKPRVNADAALSVEFLKSVRAYVDLHKKLEATLPPRPEHGTPGDVQGHETRLARLILEARSKAVQGDLFKQPVRAYFRRQIAGALAGPDGRASRQAIMEESPGRVRLQINGRYPEGMPLTTMPPPILGALPKLPEHIEYRFIGQRLVLLDLHAQLVVDYMDEAFS